MEAQVSKPTSTAKQSSVASDPMLAPSFKDGKKNNMLCLVQKKLRLGSPTDPSELEADAVADKVMRMPEGNFLQRKCAKCEEEKEKVQKKEEVTFIQAKPSGEASVSEEVGNRITQSQGGGSALDASTQTFMENRFGHDFSHVRIHTDQQAVQLSSDLHARAFTVGSDIYFNQGEFAPGSASGNHLLAHELTHVVQQSNGLKRISRATYTVGSRHVQIDYGNVVFHDNIFEYESEIERRYTAWTGQDASTIHPQISAFTNRQKRWLLYALDLLTDNPLPSLNKVNAVTRLIQYAPTASFMPLDGYDYRNPAFNFENEVLRVSGWFELALSSGLRAPSASDQQMLDLAYNHAGGSGASSGSTCPSTRSQALDEARLRADLPPLMNTYLQTRVNAINNATTRTQNISDILPIADIVQREALRFFSPYIGHGRRRDYLQNWRFSSHLQSSTSPGAIPAEVRLAYLHNRSNGEASRTNLFQQVHYDSRCEADRNVFGDIMNQLNNDATVQSQLNTIMSWQSFTKHDDTAANTVINLQSFSNVGECQARWSTINTLCHELVHAYVHSDFVALSSGRRIVTEGFTEILGDQLFQEIRTRATNNQLFRNQFEAGLSAGVCQNVSIPAPTTDYGDDGRFANGIRAIVGDDRFRAAYFLGRTRLAGLQPKLKTGASNDPLEKEADAMADRVANPRSGQVSPISSTSASLIQRNPKPGTSPLSSYNKTVVAQAKARLKVLEPILDSLEGRKLQIEAEKLHVLDDRNRLDDNAADPSMPVKKKMELDNLKNLNTLPVDIVVTDSNVVFNVKFHVRFEDPTMKVKFQELKNTLQSGIDLVWKQTLGGVFEGRSFTIVPSVTLIDMKTARDKNFWLITVRKTSTPVTYPGCTLDQPDPSAPPTSVTDARCDGGVMSLPPTHISKPGILGHELLHLFGLLDRYMMTTDISPGKKPVTTLSPTRETQGRKDPLGGQDGTILQEDLGFLFDKLGVYQREEDRSTAGLSSVKREVMRLQEIVKLGYDPNSLIPSIIRKDFNDKMIKDAENL